MKYWISVKDDWSLLIVTVGLLLAVVTGASEGNGVDTGWKLTLNLGIAGVILSVFVAVTVTVFLVFLCGGCTDMEVGTASHPACGSNKNTDFHMVATDEHDINSKIMSGSHILPGEGIPLAGFNQTGLPYALNPESHSDGFAVNEPHSPTAAFSYGYGTERVAQGVPPSTSARPLPTSPVSGYSVPAATPHRPGPHAHQAVPGTSSEPPPPSYDESIRHQQTHGYR